MVSGSTSWREFAYWHQKSSSWRTSPRSAGAGSTAYSVTWPRSGMTRTGRAYEPVTSGQLTGGNAYSFWPIDQKPANSSLLSTPLAGDDQGGQPVAVRRAGGHQVDLSDLVITLFPNVRLLPTPLASDGAKGSARQHSSQGSLLLPAVAAQLTKKHRTARTPPVGVTTSPPSAAGKQSPGEWRRTRPRSARKASRGFRLPSASG